MPCWPPASTGLPTANSVCFRSHADFVRLLGCSGSDFTIRDATFRHWVEVPPVKCAVESATVVARQCANRAGVQECQWPDRPVRAVAWRTAMIALRHPGWAIKPRTRLCRACRDTGVQRRWPVDRRPMARIPGFRRRPVQRTWTLFFIRRIVPLDRTHLSMGDMGAWRASPTWPDDNEDPNSLVGSGGNFQ